MDDYSDYRRHKLLDDDDSPNSVEDTPLLIKEPVTSKKRKSEGFFAFIKSIFTSEDESSTVRMTGKRPNDMRYTANKCSVCGDEMFSIIDGKPYCSKYASIYTRRKDKTIPVSCRHAGRCTYPECKNTGTMFLEDSRYVTEGYYCKVHVRRIDMMIQQEKTVQYMLKRSEKVTKYTGDQPEYFKDSDIVV